MRDQKFGLVLNDEERQALNRLVSHERLPAAAVVRRLIWRAAQHIDVLTNTEQAVEKEAEGLLPRAGIEETEDGW
jgi:hypothetical protein